MTSIISVDGLTIEYNKGELRVNGKKVDISGIKVETKEIRGYEIINSKTINGDINGDVRISGSGIQVIVEGDVNGNITGTGDINISGDVDGNVTGTDITIGGDIDGNVVGSNIHTSKQKSNRK